MYKCSVAHGCIRNETRAHHHELTGGKLSRITRNKNKLFKVLIDHGNLFTDTETDLCNLTTRAVVPENIASDVVNRDEIGQKASESFVKDRSTDRNVGVWEPVKKLKLGCFKKTSVQSNICILDKIVKVKEERQLLQRFIVAARSRDDLDFSDCISNYEMRLIPRSLFSPDGSLLLASDKSKMVCHLEELVAKKQEQHASTVDIATVQLTVSYKVVIIDGMALVNSNKKIKQMQTCKDFSNLFLDKLISITRNYNEVKLVFDRYQQNSLKTPTRLKRTSNKSTHYHIHDKAVITHISLKD